jgi:hypothetical protein
MTHFCYLDIGDMVSSAVESAFAMASDEADVLNKVLSNQDLGPNKDNIRNVLKWLFMKDGEEPNRDRLGVLKSMSTWFYVLILGTELLILTARMTFLAMAKDRKDNEDPDGNTVSFFVEPGKARSSVDGMQVADI